MKRHAKRVMLESLGWLLVVIGIAALILPGPGLLALFAGMALLATQYEWAERRLEPIRRTALKTATDSVESGPRILGSIVFGLLLVSLGVVWGLHPNAPEWWPLSERWWLLGGWGTGGTLIISGVIVLAMLAYSYTYFRTPNKHKHK